MIDSTTRRGHTLGVAIEIALPTRDILEAARATYENAAGEAPPHITVIAPIDVDDDAMAAVVRHLGDVAAVTAPFTLSLRGTATFRPISPVVFVVVDAGVAECTALEASVRSGVMAVETRYPYHPHVTVAHDVGDAVLDRAMRELADIDADMRVTSMGLYEHRAGRWDIVRTFEFGG